MGIVAEQSSCFLYSQICSGLLLITSNALNDCTLKTNWAPLFRHNSLQIVTSCLEHSPNWWLLVFCVPKYLKTNRAVFAEICMRIQVQLVISCSNHRLRHITFHLDHISALHRKHRLILKMWISIACQVYSMLTEAIFLEQFLLNVYVFLLEACGFCFPYNSRVFRSAKCIDYMYTENGNSLQCMR